MFKNKQEFIKTVCAALSALALFGACNSPEFFKEGFGESVIDPNKPLPGQFPVLSKLELHTAGGGIVMFDKTFSPTENVYTIDKKNLGELSYTVYAESIFTVDYTTGTTFMPTTQSYIIVTAVNGNFKNEYIISIMNDSFEKAKLASLDFSYGKIVMPGSDFSPDTTDYQVEVPYGITEVIPAAVPEIPAARVIYRTSPFPVKTGGTEVLFIQVAAPGYNVGTYTVRFIVGEPAPSFLDDIEFSAGSLSFVPASAAKFFSRDHVAYQLTLPPGTPLSVHGTVKKGSIRWSAGEERPNFGRYIASPKNGTFTVTADYGAGHTPKDYNFEFVIDPNAKFAKLCEILVDNQKDGDNAAWTLYRRDAGSRVEGATGFNDAFTSYELYYHDNLPAGVNMVISGIAMEEIRDTARINTVPSRFNELPPNEPIRLTVEHAGYLPMTYNIFLNYNDVYKPTALLKDLKLAGSALVPAFQKNIFDYTAEVVRGNNVIVTGVSGIKGSISGEIEVEEDWYSIKYSPSNTLQNIQGEETYKVKVDAGTMYRTSQYNITFKLVDLMNPLLDTLTVKEQPMYISPNVQYYKVSIPYDGADDVPFDWTFQKIGDIKEVYYSLDVGRNWVSVPSLTGFNTLTVVPGSSQLVQIKPVCYDGNLIIYNILVSREGVNDDALVLDDIQINGVSLDTFQPKVRSYVVPVTSEAPQTVTGIVSSDRTDITMKYSRDSVNWNDANDPISLTLLPGATGSVAIRLTAAGRYNDYMVTLSRSTAKFKVLSVDFDEEMGSVVVKPEHISSKGVAAGSVVSVKLIPNEGYKILTRPIVTENVTLNSVDVTGIVPESSAESNFFFSMPAADVKITAPFTEKVSTGNTLSAFLATDEQTGSKKYPVMAKFDKSRGDINIVTTTGKVTISFVGPANAKIYYNIEGSRTPSLNTEPGLELGELLVDDEGKPKTATSNPFVFDGLQMGDEINMLIYIVPDDKDIPQNMYYVTITRLQSSYADATYSGKWHYDKVEATQVFSAPVTGYYLVSIAGAQGGENQDDERAGGQGGYAYGLVKLFARQKLYIKIGGGGEHLKKSDSGAPGGWNYGANGAHDGNTWKCGGGGGGRSDVSIEIPGTGTSELILVAGGGGGGSVDSDCSPTGGGGGGGGSTGGRTEQGGFGEFSNTGEFPGAKRIDPNDDGDGNQYWNGYANRENYQEGPTGYHPPKSQGSVKGKGGGGGGYRGGGSGIYTWGYGGSGYVNKAKMAVDGTGKPVFGGGPGTGQSPARASDDGGAHGNGGIKWMGVEYDHVNGKVDEYKPTYYGRTDNNKTDDHWWWSKRGNELKNK
jgi:hypothetical protein